jgi:glycosyltransferase involved in cell wall biosynthesis
MSDPIVSVIMPAYNAEKYIAEAISSVQNQTFSDWELIIIDDGSKDDSAEIAKRYADDIKIFFLQHPNKENKGVAQTRSLGVKASKGDLIAFLDADDQFVPGKLQAQVDILNNYPGVIVTHSKVQTINETGVPYQYEFDLGNTSFDYSLQKQSYYLKENKICNSTVLIRKAELLSAHRFINQVFQFEDWFLWNILSGKGLFYYDATPYVKYRFHGASFTHQLFTKQGLQYYSKLEMLFQLLLNPQTKEDRKIIIKEIEEQVNSLLCMYSQREKLDIDKLDIVSQLYSIANYENRKRKATAILSLFKRIKTKASSYVRKK